MKISFIALVLSSIVGLAIGKEGNIRSLKSECICDIGTIPDGNGTCVPDCADTPPACAAVLCPINTDCVGSLFDDVGATCICSKGYKFDKDGKCIPTDDGEDFVPNECASLTCPTNTDCVQSSDGTAICVCAKNHQPTKDGTCILNPGCAPPECAAVSCRTNTECVENATGDGVECVCAAGFKLDVISGECVPDTCYFVPDKFSNVRCPGYTDCLETSSGSVACVCSRGYKYNTKKGQCVPANDGCLAVPPKECASLTCPTNSECVNAGSDAVCVCASGYKFDKNGECVPNPDCPTPLPEKCALTLCPPNTECVAADDGSDDVQCVCLPGFKKENNKTGSKCVKDVCAGVRCRKNSRCIETKKGNARCICRKNFIENKKGNCVRK